MGIVYAVYDRECNRMFAFKTFQDKYIWDEDAIQRFITEAVTWTELERHTNIVFANYVLNIHGKPFLFLDYIGGGDLNQFIGKLTIEQGLDFAIQFCTGMEYAYHKLGVIHRDIKPANVLVHKDPEFRFGYCFKVTDFGLVKALGDEFQGEFVEVSTVMGTIPFMPPEQFPKRIQKTFSFHGLMTTRSDIYSFGVTLYVLLTGKLPFSNLEEIFLKKPEHPLFLNQKIPESLDRLILKCLEKDPNKRYTTFKGLQEDLLEIFKEITGEVYVIVGKNEELTGADWNDKGIAFDSLGKPQEALACYNKALAINPKLPGAWNNKGIALVNLGKPQEACGCFDQALEIYPKSDDVWNNKGLALLALKKFPEALECFNKVLEKNPRDFIAWYNKGAALAQLGEFQEAIWSCDKALEIYPRECNAWNNKGLALLALKKFPEALECYDKALEINPRDEEMWNNKGFAFLILGKFHESLWCLDTALNINPTYYRSWRNKGIALHKMGKKQEAIICFEKYEEFAPKH